MAGNRVFKHGQGKDNFRVTLSHTRLNEMKQLKPILTFDIEWKSKTQETTYKLAALQRMIAAETLLSMQLKSSYIKLSISLRHFRNVPHI